MNTLIASLSFYPTIEVILNIEEDHLDFFKDINDIRHSFRLFAEKIPKGGLLVINSGIENINEIISGLPCRIVTLRKKTFPSMYTAPEYHI